MFGLANKCIFQSYYRSILFSLLQLCMNALHLFIVICIYACMHAWYLNSFIYHQSFFKCIHPFYYTRLFFSLISLAYYYHQINVTNSLYYYYWCHHFSLHIVYFFTLNWSLLIDSSIHSFFFPFFFYFVF